MQTRRPRFKGGEMRENKLLSKMENQLLRMKAEGTWSALRENKIRNLYAIAINRNVLKMASSMAKMEAKMKVAYNV